MSQDVQHESLENVMQEEVWEVQRKETCCLSEKVYAHRQKENRHSSKEKKVFQRLPQNERRQEEGLYCQVQCHWKEETGVDEEHQDL